MSRGQVDTALLTKTPPYQVGLRRCAAYCVAPYLVSAK